MERLPSIRPVATPVLREPFPRSGFPAPETARRRRTTQIVAIIALLVGLVYLVWRTVDTVDLGVWWVSVPLLLLEAHAFVGLAMFTTSLWDLDTLTPAAPRESTAFSLAILIPTYNEPTEILLPVIAAAVSTRLAHETWVLDDGARPEVAALAARLGARYLARPTHEHAKAGNVNYALSYVDADLIAILDADHVPQGDFLVKTVGYFDDESVALVQTPQDFYNLDSFEHAGPYQDQQLFYRALQPGRNRWGAAFWCGTGAVVRATALRDVGGLATETVTETSTRPSASIAVVGGRCTTTSRWPAASRPAMRSSTSTSGCAGASVRCRYCASRTRRPFPASSRCSGSATCRRCSGGSTPGGSSATS